MPFQKGNKRGFVSGPGHTGAAQAPPRGVAEAEAAQAARESDPRNQVKPGQDAFDQAQKDLHSYGRQANIDGGIPAEVLDGGFIDPTPLPKYSREAVREMFPHDTDLSSVPDKLARTYGLDKSTHTAVWCLCDDNDGKGTSFEAQHMADNPWDEICLDREGKKLFRSGMVLFKRPREVSDDIQARFNEVSETLKATAPNENPPVDEHDPETLKKRDEMSRVIQAMLADSPSKHLGADNLDTAMQRFTPEQTQKFKEDSRYGRSAMVSAENARDKTAEQLKDIATGKVGTFAMGASIDPNTGQVVRS